MIQARDIWNSLSKHDIIFKTILLLMRTWYTYPAHNQYRLRWIGDTNKVRDVYVMTINIGRNDYTRMSHASREFNGTFPHAATSAIDPLIPRSFSYVYIVAFLIWTWYSTDKSLYISSICAYINRVQCWLSRILNVIAWMCAFIVAIRRIVFIMSRGLKTCCFFASFNYIFI